MGQHEMVQYEMVQHEGVQYEMVQHEMVQHERVQHKTLWVLLVEPQHVDNVKNQLEMDQFLDRTRRIRILGKMHAFPVLRAAVHSHRLKLLSLGELLVDADMEAPDPPVWVRQGDAILFPSEFGPELKDLAPLAE